MEEGKGGEGQRESLVSGRIRGKGKPEERVRGGEGGFGVPLWKTEMHFSRGKAIFSPRPRLFTSPHL